MRGYRKLLVVAALFVMVFGCFGNYFYKEAFKPSEVLANDIIEKRDSYAKHHLNDDGTITANISSIPVHYKNEEGIYEEIDLNITKEKDGEFEYSVKKNTFKSYFNDASSIEDSTLACFEITNSQGNVRSIRYKLLGAEPKGHSFRGNQFIYQNVFKNVDVEYLVSSGKLKENVIINKPLNEYKFSFVLDMDNFITIEEKENGVISFIDEETNEVLWEVEKLYAEDSSKEKLYTNNVRYELSDVIYKGKIYKSILLILDDEEFLKNAVFPIIIDPSISTSSLTNYKTWCIGPSNEPNGLKVGTDADRDGWEFGVKANISLPSNITINSATLDMKVTDINRIYNGDPKYSVFNINLAAQNWDGSYAAAPTKGELVSFEQSFYSFVEDSYVSMDITKAVQSWYSGANPNYGLLVTPSHMSEVAYCTFAEQASIRITYSVIQQDGTPKVNIVSPHNGQVLGNADTSFIPKISVSDINGDMLTCEYFIDNETTPRASKSITGSGNPLEVSFTTINATTLNNGPHTITFKVKDGTSDVIMSQTFNKGGLNYESSISSIKILGFGMANKDSFDSYTYKYTIGAFSTNWISRNEFTKYDLLPNTLYSSKLQIKDNKELIREVAQNIYTKSQVPVTNITKTSSNSFELGVKDSNPSITKYLISVNDKYVGSTGVLTATPTWIALSNKTITVKELVPDTLYKIRVKSRNEENKETVYSNWVSIMTLK